MKSDVFQALSLVLSDPETMWHYPYTFDGRHVKDWIERSMNRYRKDGFGLWAVCLKDIGEMIGDCALKLQNINGELLPEIGYHIRRDCQRKGYAKEAAKAVCDGAFRDTDYPALYFYCKYTNVPSFRTEESIGMCFAFEYPDEINATSHVSMMSREAWLSELTDPMIRWAESQQGSGIEFFGGDFAKASALLYADGMSQGKPEQGAFVFYDCVCRVPDGPVNWGHCGICLGDSKVIHAWDEMAAKYDRANLQGLGYGWKERSIEYVISLIDGDVRGADRTVILPDMSWVTVQGRTADLAKIYQKIYQEGRMEYEIERFTDNGDCEIIG